jgi:hypothetical protein
VYALLLSGPRLSTVALIFAPLRLCGLRRYLEIESMDEQLPYCATEDDLAGTASRLELALRRKIGHVVVAGEDRDDVNIFVSVVLDSISGYDFIELSGQQLELPEVTGSTEGARVIAVVYDADLMSGAALEELRAWAETNFPPIGLVLVGTPALERALAQFEARALARLVHTRVVLMRSHFEQAANAGHSARGYALMPLILGGAVAVCIGLTVGTQGLPGQPVMAALTDAVANSAAWLWTQLTALVAS